MTKLYLIFVLCALTSAEYAGLQHSNEDALASALYAASRQSGLLGSVPYAASRQSDPVGSALYAASSQSDPTGLAHYATSRQSDPVGSALYAASRQSDPTGSAHYATSRQSDPVGSALYAASRQSDPTGSAHYATSRQSDPVGSALYAASRQSDPTGLALHAASRQSDPVGVYHAATTQSRTTSSVDGNEQNAYISHTGAVRSGTATPSSYTQQHAYVGSTSDKQDHNGLTQDEILKLVADGHRRRLQLYNAQRNRPRLPKRYNKMFGRNDEGADTNAASLYGSPGSHQISARNADSTGDGNEANKEDAAQNARQDQEAENARRFFLLNSRYNPPNANNPLDPYAELNNRNYNEAFGQYKKFLNQK